MAFVFSHINRCLLLSTLCVPQLLITFLHSIPPILHQDRPAQQANTRPYQDSLEPLQSFSSEQLAMELEHLPTEILHHVCLFVRISNVLVLVIHQKLVLLSANRVNHE